ncbi:transposase DDE domain protein [mine drainage metagenome]|uniref:Transposase DDE domain protein n=1 Tax=mine drainage metagenome TaxID=410659 RepID=A0A1J5QYE2_9ZZZZ
MARMFIRQTRTNNKATGEGYFTYRLVRGERIAGKVRQVTVLNLGRHFPVPQDDWALLCSRIEQLLAPQALLCDIKCPPHLERAAQRYVGQLIARSLDPPSAAPGTPAPTAPGGEVKTGAPGATDTPDQTPVATAQAAQASAARRATVSAVTVDLQTLDIASMVDSLPRSVGVEHVGLHAISQLGLVDTLTELGINAVMRACIVGNLIGRIAAPGSELATWDWLQRHSALGELLDVDFEGLSHMRLYRASDLLMKHRQAIEAHVFGAVTSLFSLTQSVTLYDLTNTYFEGQATHNPKAQFGRSKEKRSDCPLVTLGLVLDGSGFVQRSKTFEGNVSEGTTLQVMLAELAAPAGALVIMDAGIATQANIDWLIEHKYRYLVVRRGGSREFDAQQSVSTQTVGRQTVRLQKVLSADGQEVQLHCHSEGRQAKEQAMSKRFCTAFEAGLKKIADGLSKPRSERRLDKLNERIGRLKQRSRGVSQHYQITLTADEAGKNATALSFKQEWVSGTMATHPGVYCLRTNVLDWDAEKLWQAYSTLTDIESVFRSFKSELGLRPVFHHKEDRADGHLFITVLAYQCVQLIRAQLKEQAQINDSWDTLRKTMQVQRRTTTSMRRADGRMVHVRKTSRAEPELARIYQALGIEASPGSIKKLVV